MLTTIEDLNENVAADALADAMAVIAAARPGEHIVYFAGLLVAAREKDLRLSATANAYWRAYENGLVHLFQRRVWGRCEYVAIKREARA